jgi:hypothetical protein
LRTIVGTITAYEHRGWVRVVMTANTGEVLATDLDADAASGSFCGS